MKYGVFEKMILDLEEISERYGKLYDLGVDVLAYGEPYQRVIAALLEESFGKAGKDWIEWYLYERKSHSGEILKAWNKEGREICHNSRSLWEEVNTT